MDNSRKKCVFCVPKNINNFFYLPKLVVLLIRVKIRKIKKILNIESDKLWSTLSSEF